MESIGASFQFDRFTLTCLGSPGMNNLTLGGFQLDLRTSDFFTSHIHLTEDNVLFIRYARSSLIGHR